MATKDGFRVVLGRSVENVKAPDRPPSRVDRTKLPKVTFDAQEVVSALKATPGADEVIAQVPHLGDAQYIFPVAIFSPCTRFGTARWLDIWDCDHFDEVTDMQENLADCRVWFSDRGFTTWGAPETRTGRINCFFTVPADGHYVCNVSLESDGGLARVECLIDSFSFGPLPFNGTVFQPHPSFLNAGGHHFRIRQMNGAFYFYSLTIWRVF